MGTVAGLAGLYLLFKFLVPIALVALVAYVVYRAVARPAEPHTFASTLPEDRLDEGSQRPSAYLHDDDRLP